MYYLKNDIANGNIVMFQIAGINGTDSTVNVHVCKRAAETHTMTNHITQY